MIVWLGAALLLQSAAAMTTAEAIAVIRRVGSDGIGNEKASEAWRHLAAGGAGSVVEILKGMEGANPLALNWLRGAVDALADRERKAGVELPLDALVEFVRQTTQHPRARRFAYELIADRDASRAERLIGSMLDDPSTELRRDAVARLVAEAAGLRASQSNDQAVAKYQRALRSARDVDQVEEIAAGLKELGHPVKLAEVFGWVREWKVIGPFDSTGGSGFERVYPPEQELDFQAEYAGKTDQVKWQPLTVESDYGLVDLNKPLGMKKEVAGYAYAEVQAESARAVELRLGCKNAWKVWFNGKYLFGREEYHRGMEIDQYRLRAQLQPGRNTILVKVCQNEQQEDWTVEWEFQLRITDELGTPIIFAKDLL